MDDSVKHSDYWGHLAVFVLALALHLGFLVWVDDPALFAKYPFFAQKLVSGQGIGERIVDLSPLYLYLTAAFAWVFGENWSLLKALHAIAGSVNCLLILELGRRLFNRRVGIGAALLFAFYGNAVVLVTTLEPTVFVILFNLAAVLSLVRAGEGFGRGQAFWRPLGLAGVFTGLSVITKPSFLLFLPLGSLWLLLGRLPRAKTVVALAMFNGLALALVFPVTLRNYLALDDLVLVTADAGKVFFHGNAAGATALSWTGLDEENFAKEAVDEPDAAHVIFRRKASAITGRSLRPSEASRFWARRALADITADPGAYAIRQAGKLALFFNDYEMHFIASAYKEYRQVRGYPLMRYGLIAALALLGMVLAAGSWRRRFLLYGTIGIYLVSGLIFMVQSRYRLPAVPYMAIFAAYGIARMAAMAAGGRRSALMACLLVLTLLFAACRIPFAGEIAAMERWQTATKIHYELRALPLFRSGRYVQAVAALDRCLALAPDCSPALSLRGKSRAMLGQWEAALKDFQQVIRISPGAAAGYRGAGFVHLLQKDPDAARFYLEKALLRDPADDRVRKALKGLS